MSVTIKKISVIICIFFISIIFLLDLAQTTVEMPDQGPLKITYNDPPGNSSCYSCHVNLTGYLDDKLSKPAVDWRYSIHFSSESLVMCSDCHGGDRTIYILTDAKSETSGFQMYLSKDYIIELCGSCHSSKLEEFTSSIHWKELNNDTRLTCVDCHNNHNIKSSSNPDSPVFRENIPQTCRRCHEDEYKNFLKTFHGKNYNLDNYQVALCTDCHNSHEILAETNPNSLINSNNMAYTCASCHDNEGDLKITDGMFHDNRDSHSPDLIFDKDGLTNKERLYYIGPFDLVFYIPLIYEIFIAIFVAVLLSLILLETIISKLFRRGIDAK